MLKRCTFTTMGCVGNACGLPTTLLEDEDAWFASVRDTFGLDLDGVSAGEWWLLWEVVHAQHTTEQQRKRKEAEAQGTGAEGSAMGGGFVICAQPAASAASGPGQTPADAEDTLVQFIVLRKDLGKPADSGGLG